MPNSEFMRRLRKLRRMSASEILGRVRQRLRVQRERREYSARNGRATSSGDPLPTRQTGKALLNRSQAVVPGTALESIERFQHEFPTMCQSLAETAEQRATDVLSGRWNLLGHPVDLRGSVDWHRDPVTGAQFQRLFYADVPLDQNATNGVDVKYVWELGRQQYLVDLSRGWMFQRRPQYAERAHSLMLDWIEKNPLHEGVHWTSGLEVAMRSISWIWTLASMGEWEGWSDGDLEQIADSLSEHADYLEAHFSLYSSPYNHLIGEATALLLVAKVLPNDTRSASWQRAARDVLKEHGPRQFYTDGFSVEQAMGYHFYTLGFLALAMMAARDGTEPLAEVEEHAHRAFKSAMHFRQPDGRWPAIGDVDSARSVPVQPVDFWNFDGLCSAAAVLFNDSQLKLPGMLPGEELYWLMGTDGVCDWHRLETGETACFAVLEESGYVVGQSEGDWLCFDAGPVAHGLHSDGTPSTAHGHLDTLQVLYCHSGEPVLVDSGMPFYFGDREWVRYFRSPASHNTLEIEGLPLARDAGRLEWSHVVPRPKIHADAKGVGWTAWARISSGSHATIERHVLWRPQCGVWIADWISLDQPRRIQWFWQTGTPLASCEPPQADDRFTSKDQILFGSWSNTGPCALSVEESASSSPENWQAPGYGILIGGSRIRERAPTTKSILKVSFAGPKPQSFTVALHGQIVANNRHLDPSNSEIFSDGAAVWRFCKSFSSPMHSQESENYTEVVELPIRAASA